MFIIYLTYTNLAYTNTHLKNARIAATIHRMISPAMPTQLMLPKVLKRQVGYKTSEKSQKKKKGLDADSMIVN